MAYSFKFNHLAPLCRDIRKNKKSIEQFKIKYNAITFDCIIDIDAEPFEMIVGVLDLNFAFTLYIRQGYVTEMDADDFYRLCSILNLKPAENHFSSFAFLNLIDRNIPNVSNPDLVPVESVLPYRIAQMTEEDKKEGFIFCGWLPHKGKCNGHVTNSNLKKTRKLLGKPVSDYCEKNDISTKWSTNESLRTRLDYPWKNMSQSK